MKGSSATTNSTTHSLKRKSADVGWEYGELINPDNYDKIKCNLCGKMFSGGIYRLKQHVAGIRGNVTSCPKATPSDQNLCKEALNVTKRKKNDKKWQFEGIIEEGEGEGEEENVDDALFNNKSDDVHAYLARWVYESGISYSAISIDAFHRFVEAVGKFGPGYIPPSQYQLREPLLKQEVERTRESLRNQEEEWKKSGCSIVIDSWHDRKRSVVNLCVNCKGGTCFSSFVQVLSYAPQTVFEYVDKHIEEVGPQNVVQVVTDSTGYNMEAAKMLKKKRPNIFWSSCAKHTLDLILERIGGLPNFKSVIDEAKALITFIYSDPESLAMMRKFTKKRDIVRPGVTRITSSFLTIENILKNREKLSFMFVSDEWSKCELSKTLRGTESYATIISQKFWNCLSACMKVFKPLVKVLRLVDKDVKPSMSFVYGELQEAKNKIIIVCNNVEAVYKPIIEVIDSMAKGRLDSSLHLAGYLLNPYYYYGNDEVERDPKCMEAIMTCIETFFAGDNEKQHIVSNVELLKYKRMEGMFSKKLAIMGRSKNDDSFDPVGWWLNYGCETPHLRTMAMRILSLTSTSSGCKINWNVFDGINTERMTRLDAERLKNLVYVGFNAKLVNKSKMDKKCDVLLADDGSMAQGWITKCGDLEVGIGETPDEDTFESDVADDENTSEDSDEFEYL